MISSASKSALRRITRTTPKFASTTSSIASKAFVSSSSLRIPHHSQTLQYQRQHHAQQIRSSIFSFDQQVGAEKQEQHSVVVTQPKFFQGRFFSITQQPKNQANENSLQDINNNNNDALLPPAYAQAEDLISSAAMHIKQGQFEEAIAEYTKAFDLVVKEGYRNRKELNQYRYLCSTAMRMRGRIHQEVFEDFPKAISDYSAAIEKHSLDAESHARRGMCYVETKAIQNAIDDLSYAIQAGHEQDIIHTLPKLFEQVFRARGSLHYQKRKFRKAIEDFTDAIRLNQSMMAAAQASNNNNNNNNVHQRAALVEVYIQRGHAHLAVEQFEAALADYEAVIGMCQERINQVENSLSDEEAKEVKADALATIKSLRRNQIRALIGLEKYSEALDICDDMLDEAEEDNTPMTADKKAELKKIYETKARIHQEQGDLMRTIVDYTQIIHLNPQDSSAYVNRGKALLELAEQEAIEAEKRAGKDAELVVAAASRGAGVVDLDHERKAFDDFTRAIQCNPNEKEAHVHKARIYARQEQWHNALEHFKKAVELEQKPTTKAVLYLDCGDMYLRMGREDEALNQYAQAVMLDPTNTAVQEAYSGLMNFYKTQNNFSES